jgi:hypothetical protein
LSWRVFQPVIRRFIDQEIFELPRASLLGRITFIYPINLQEARANLFPDTSGLDKTNSKVYHNRCDRYIARFTIDQRKEWIVGICGRGAYYWIRLERYRIEITSEFIYIRLQWRRSMRKVRGDIGYRNWKVDKEYFRWLWSAADIDRGGSMNW